MRKLIALLMVFVGITSGAMAETKEYKSGDFVCARVNEIINSTDEHTKLQGDPYVYARIYFDTGKAVAHDGCNYDELINALIDKKNDVEYCVFIGMADKQGASKGYDNTKLGYGRARYVADLFNHEISDHIYDAGDSNAEAFSEAVNNQEYRSVDIYVIWKQPACKENTINEVNELEQKVVAMGSSGAKIQMQSKIKEIKEICKTGGKSLTSSESERYAQLLAELADLAAQSGLGSDLQILYISDYLHELDMKETVWRNKEGKFNTARLASDSIAAVVLGTAGGLITSKVVKKNQVKSGFEDISCTIGGQKVADWHDEFTVGIQ